MIAGKYLIMITQIIKVGEILSQPIYRIEKVDIVPYQSSELHLSDEQKRFNRQYLQMVTNFLQAPFFYMSYSYDLSHTLQNLYQPMSKQMFAEENLFQRVSVPIYKWAT